MSTTLKTSAKGSAVQPDSADAVFKQHLRWTNLYGTSLKRMMAKPSLTDADRKAVDRRARKQRGRQEGIAGLAAAYPDLAWARAYVSAVKAEATPDSAASRPNDPTPHRGPHRVYKNPLRPFLRAIEYTNQKRDGLWRNQVPRRHRVTFALAATRHQNISAP